MSNIRECKNLSYGEEKLDLYLPEKMPAPLFVYFHGGGLEAGDKESFAPLARSLAESGIAVASANYRMYPSAKWPDYLEDGAQAIAFLRKNGEQWGGFTKTTVSGSSAGGYLSMMLYFDPRYLGKYGIEPDGLDWIFDAGQPTTHFNVLRERGIDTRAIRIDEAAPMYFVDHPVEKPLEKARLLFLAADNDMPCRWEQHEVLLRTMYAFGYSPARTRLLRMCGYSHCGYSESEVFADIIREFIQQENK